MFGATYKGTGTRYKGAPLTAGYPTPSSRAVLWDADFCDTSLASTVFQSSLAGTGVNVLTLDTVNPGVLSQRVSAVADRASHQTSPTGLTFDGSLRLLCRFRIRVPVLSTGADQFILREGFGDTTSGDQVDGAYIEWDASVTANVQCKTAANSVRTTVDSGVAWVANTWHDVTILGNATSVLFYLDGVLVASISTNIPAGAARAFGGNGHSIKIVGATQRLVDIDYHLGLALFDAARGVPLEA